MRVRSRRDSVTSHQGHRVAAFSAVSRLHAWCRSRSAGRCTRGRPRQQTSASRASTSGPRLTAVDQPPMPPCEPGFADIGGRPDRHRRSRHSARDWRVRQFARVIGRSRRRSPSRRTVLPPPSARVRAAVGEIWRGNGNCREVRSSQTRPVPPEPLRTWRTVRMQRRIRGQHAHCSAR